MITRKLIVSCAVTAAAAACTSVSTGPDSSLGSATKARTGIPYSLPMRQYVIKVTRTLTRCEIAATGEKVREEIKFVIEVDVDPRDIPGETYVIDYEKLGGWTKTTSMSIENHETGTLKSINAKADDKSGEVIKTAAQIAIGIASITSGVPVATAGEVKRVQKIINCASGTSALIAVLKNRMIDLKRESDALAEVTGQVEKLSSLARIKALSKVDRTKLSELIDSQRSGARAVADAQDALGKARDALSATQIVIWPRNFKELSSQLTIGANQLDRLSKLVIAKDITAADMASKPSCDATKSMADCLASSLKVSAVLSGVYEAKVAKTSGPQVDTADGGSVDGILVRPPVPGVLTLCNSDEASCGGAASKFLFRSEPVLVPQLGQLRLLPFKNKMFQNNEVSVSLGKDGRVERFEFKTLRSQAEELSLVGASVVSQYGKFIESKMKLAEEQREKAEQLESAARDEEIAALQYEIDMLTKKQQLEKLRSPADSELVSVQALAAVTNSRIALLEALLAERQARRAVDKTN